MTYMYIIYLQHISYAGFPSYVQPLSSAPTLKRTNRNFFKSERKTKVVKRVYM